MRFERGQSSGAGTTSSATEFNPPNTDVDTVRLSELCTSSSHLAVQVLGDSEAEYTAITGTAKEFSDLISDDISSAASYNEKEWRKACLVLTYAASVARQWLDDVYEFRKDRRGLIDAYDKEVATLLAEYPLLANHDGGVSAGQLEVLMIQTENFNSRKSSILGRYVRRGNELKETLLETARERATMLDEGPDPSNLKTLVDAGILGWGAYNIMGVDTDTPLPVSKAEAKVMAREMEAYLNGDKDPDARFEEILATLGAVNAKAAALQEANKHTMGLFHPMHGNTTRGLSEEEVEFLETFYNGLEDMTPTGVVHLMPWLEGAEGPDWTPAQRNTFATGIANGLLTLSDEGLGGGQDRLPESVQELANGIPFADWRANRMSDGRAEGVDSHNWLADAEDFSQLLQHSSPELRGGAEFSSNLTLSMGHHLGNNHLAITQQREESIGALLDVSTRNEEANHHVLTSTNGHPAGYSDDPRYDNHRMPDFESNADALLGLYAFDWRDDGDAVAGLTDWIPGFSEGTPSQVEMAGRATAGLMRTLADGGDGGPFHDTDDQSDTSYQRAVTEINPKLTESLTRIYLNYEDDFVLNSDNDGFGQASGTNETLLLHAPGDLALHLSDETKQGFLQLLIADDSNAPIITTSIEGLERRVIDAAIGSPGDASAGIAGARVGELRTILHDAMINEYVSRTDDREEAKQQAADNWQTAFNIGVAFNNGVLGSVPGPGTALAFTGESLLRLLEHPQKAQYLEEWSAKNQGDEAPIADIVDTGPKAHQHAQLQLLQVYLDHEAIDVQDLKDRGLLPPDHAGSDPVYPAVVETVSKDEAGYFPVLNRVLEDAGQATEVNGGHKAWVENYLSAVERYYNASHYVTKDGK